MILLQVLSSSPSDISFRRDLVDPRHMSCYLLLSRLDSINLTQGRDVFCWNLITNVSFTVDSMYHALSHSKIWLDQNKQIWKSQIPLKVKIFMWYLRRGLCCQRTTSLPVTGKKARSVANIYDHPLDDIPTKSCTLIRIIYQCTH